MAEGAGQGRPLTIMLIVGEPSGDQLGAQLMAGLKNIAPGVQIVGVGGPAMTAQGLQSLFPLDATSVMGLREVVPRIPQILARVREAVAFARETRPDLVVAIDSPDFTHRVIRKLKRIAPSIRTANYAPPQVWATRGYRAKAMASYFDAVLTLFPFENEYFERHGLRAICVGYPVIERLARMTGGDALRARLAIAKDAPLIAVLPGSRRNELRFLLPPFKQTVALLAREIPGLVSLMPTIAAVAPLFREGARDWPTPVHVLETEDDKFAAFDAADAALAASGTVTSELALAKTPMVVAYRLGWLTARIAMSLMRAPHFVLANLILGREAIPEFLQDACKPEAMAAAVKRLLTDPEVRSRQLRDLEEAVRGFGVGQESPSLRAARAVRELAQG